MIGVVPAVPVVLSAERHREAAEVFGGAYLVGPVTDRMWSRSAATYKGSTVHALLEDDDSIGAVARAFLVTLAVPGGSVPAAGVSSVGVRADRRRRGHLRSLMTAQLEHLRAAGAVAATLRATEATIYERFGYGVASAYGTLTVDRARARLRTGAAPERALRLVNPTAALQVLPQVHDRLVSSRPGAISRPTWWWTNQVARMLDKDEPLWVLCTEDGDGEVDGWVVYTATHTDTASGEHRAQVSVIDLVGATPEVELALWQAAMAIDLAETVVAQGRPLDDDLPLALVDPRAARLSSVEDETWLRLLDVPTALSARTYGSADAVVLAVDDQLVPENSGRYRVGTDGAERTGATAEIEIGVAELASVYLGGTRFAALATAGRVRGDAPALRRADLLFASDRMPWSGTYF